MKIIVSSAEEVGFNIAKQLVDENNDVTIIDESEELLRQINHNLDVKTICGNHLFLTHWLDQKPKIVIC